jgi:hypothetical protein
MHRACRDGRRAWALKRSGGDGEVIAGLFFHWNAEWTQMALQHRNSRCKNDIDGRRRWSRARAVMNNGRRDGMDPEAAARARNREAA